MRITTPDDTVIGPISLGAMNASYPGVSTANGTVYVENGVSTSGGGDPEIYVEVNVSTIGQSMNGTWTYTLIPVALGPANGEVDLWRAFSDAHAVFTVGNSVDELIVEPGNADSLITAAAFLTKDTWIDCGGRTTNDGLQPFGTLAGFSSPGPDAHRRGVQARHHAAPGVEIGSTTSFDVHPTCGATPSVFLNDGMNHMIDAGTSMSAPHVAGVVALLEQRYGAITPSFAKSYLQAHAVVDGNTGPTWNQDWGWGKLFLGDLSTGVDPLPGAVADFAITLSPNPSFGITTVEFSVPREADVVVTVHDVQGPSGRGARARPPRRAAITRPGATRAPARASTGASASAGRRSARSGSSRSRAEPRRSTVRETTPRIELDHQLSQLLDVRGLDQIVIEPGGVAAAPVVVLSPAGERDERRLAELRTRSDAAGDLVSVEPRHADVEEHDIGVPSLERLQRGGSVVHHRHVRAETP